MEENKLIAEFMGRTYRPVRAGYETGSSWQVSGKEFRTQEECLEYCTEYNKGKDPDCCYFPLPNTDRTLSLENGEYVFECKYNRDWSWLMPVVEKICRLKIGDGVETVEYPFLRTFGLFSE